MVTIMTENELEQILAGFNGDEGHDFSYYFSNLLKFKDDTDGLYICKKMTKTLGEKLSTERRRLFYETLHENGLGYLIDNNPVKLYSVSPEDAVLLKRWFLGEEIDGITPTTINFDTATLVGHPLTFTAPRELVEELKNKRKGFEEDGDSKRPD